MIPLSEGHACKILQGYLVYYPGSRTHLGLGKNTLDGRAIEAPDIGPVRRRVMVGGLHSRYYHEAA